MAISVLTGVGKVTDTVIDAIADRLPKIKVGPAWTRVRDGPADHA
jgi:hypothetical protein